MQVWVLIENIPEVGPEVVGVFASEAEADAARRMWCAVQGPFDLQKSTSE
jgi:hypothetical protein